MSDEALRDAMRSRMEEGQLSCEAAHEIAKNRKLTPEEIGKHANDFDIRITQCQLGLFGYAPKKGMPGYKLVQKLDTLPQPVSSEVKKAAVQGRISCRMLWGIADQHDVKRLDTGNVVETLGIKVTPCQLGCF